MPHRSHIAHRDDTCDGRMPSHFTDKGGNDVGAQQGAKFSAFFVSYLLSRNSRIEEDLVDQLFNSSERRLARLLLLLADFGKEGAKPVTVTLSQEVLADMIGTTRSRVSFFMNRFRKKGFISYNGKIEVHRSLLDAVLHDKPHIREDE